MKIKNGILNIIKSKKDRIFRLANNDGEILLSITGQNCSKHRVKHDTDKRVNYYFEQLNIAFLFTELSVTLKHGMMQISRVDDIKYLNICEYDGNIIMKIVCEDIEKEIPNKAGKGKNYLCQSFEVISNMHNKIEIKWTGKGQ